MKIKKLLLYFPILICLLSCSDEEQIPTMSASQIRFKLTSYEEYFTTQYYQTLIEAESNIQHVQHPHTESEDSIMVIKAALFKFYDEFEQNNLNTCEQIGVKLIKKEAKNNLVYNSYFNTWNYNSLDDEYNFFFQDYDNALIEVTLCYLHASLTVNKSNNDFIINRFYKVNVNGLEKWAIEASFKGKALGYAHPKTKVFFELEEGRLEGVLN